MGFSLSSIVKNVKANVLDSAKQSQPWKIWHNIKNQDSREFAEWSDPGGLWTDYSKFDNPPEPPDPSVPLPPSPFQGADEEVRRREQEDALRRRRRKYYSSGSSDGYGTPDTSGSHVFLGE